MSDAGADNSQATLHTASSLLVIAQKSKLMHLFSKCGTGAWKCSDRCSVPLTGQHACVQAVCAFTQVTPPSQFVARHDYVLLAGGHQSRLVVSLPFSLIEACSAVRSPQLALIMLVCHLEVVICKGVRRCWHCPIVH